MQKLTSALLLLIVAVGARAGAIPHYGNDHQDEKYDSKYESGSHHEEGAYKYGGSGNYVKGTSYGKTWGSDYSDKKEYTPTYYGYGQQEYDGHDSHYYTPQHYDSHQQHHDQHEYSPYQSYYGSSHYTPSHYQGYNQHYGYGYEQPKYDKYEYGHYEPHHEEQQHYYGYGHH
ncbi:unnamed protein product, partial [Mesorhabditis spiculigera]